MKHLAHRHKLRSQGSFYTAVVIIKDLDIAKYIKFLESILNKKTLTNTNGSFFLAPTVAASSCGGVHHKRYSG
jgi:hypothetical protein